MNDPLSFAWLHDAVTWLLTPALAALLLACAIALIEAGLAVGERLSGLARLQAAGDVARVQAVARHRLERADLLARIPPMLGLMATIIPLGPGLAALGKGDPAQLASAVTVAFDATVLGLVAAEVKLDACVRVKPGARIPLDGQVVEHRNQIGVGAFVEHQKAGIHRMRFSLQRDVDRIGPTAARVCAWANRSTAAFSRRCIRPRCSR